MVSVSPAVQVTFTPKPVCIPFGAFGAMPTSPIAGGGDPTFEGYMYTVVVPTFWHCSVNV